jgi:hypothetical protein
MDYKDFKDGLTSLSSVIFIFSLTFIIGVIVLQYQTQLTTPDKDFIVILCVINVIFSIYYLMEAIRLDKIFKLEDKHVFKFGRRIGIITIIYSPHFFIFISLFLRGLNTLHLMMVFLIFLMEGILFALVFKEVYDLLFVSEAEAKRELKKNRQLYLERSEKPIRGIDY